MQNTLSRWKLDNLQIETASHIDPTLKSLPQYIFSMRSAVRTALLQKVGVVVQRFIDTGGSIASEGVDGVVDDSEVPEMGPTTLWWKLEAGHPTWRGECIHWGPCGR